MRDGAIETLAGRAGVNRLFNFRERAVNRAQIFLDKRRGVRTGRVELRPREKSAFEHLLRKERPERLRIVVEKGERIIGDGPSDFNF